jgi:hypothetical protein
MPEETMDLVYSINEEISNVVFAERNRALYVDQLYDALTSRTWDEFRASLPEGGWEEFLERFGGEYDADDNLVDDFPTGSEPFDNDYQQTGYPDWLANIELDWFPEDLIEKYGGQVEHSMASDDSLHLPAEKAEEIAADLRERGHTVEPSPIDLI